jgi:hypothetical protein
MRIQKRYRQIGSRLRNSDDLRFTKRIKVNPNNSCTAATKVSEHQNISITKLWSPPNNNQLRATSIREATSAMINDPFERSRQA